VSRRQPSPGAAFEGRNYGAGRHIFPTPAALSGARNGSFSIWHWLIVLVIVMLVFGTKKLRNIGQDLAVR
jgi:uncharacterized membrane protein